MKCYGQAIFPILLGSAVLTQPGQCVEGISWVEPNKAEACQFLGQLEGASGYGKTARWQPMAKAQVERKAEQLGATTLVKTGERDFGAFNGVVTVKAYRCSSS
jgi:hypothetical protein